MEPLPQWSLLQYGDPVDAVIRILVSDGTKIMGCTMDTPSRAVIVKGDIPNAIFQRETILVLQSKVIEVKPTLTLEIGANSTIHGIFPCEVQKMQRIIEMCSGIGVWSSMASYVDLHCIAGVDTNPRWETIFNLLHADSNFLVGDCGDRAVIQQLVAQNGIHATVIAGINCQPHSTGGDQRGLQDERATSLPKVLRAIWLLQSPCAILECVPAIMTNPEAQKMLKSFCRQTRMHLSQSILQLADVWCTRRERWFAVLTSPILGEIEVPSLPKDGQFGVVKKVMPFVRTWDPQEEEQLKLTLYELSSFNSFAVGGLDNLFLKPEEVMPTSLHSISNQLYPCSCGCRPAFSMDRMKNRGLYGVLISLGTEVFHDYRVLPECRYPHPAELFLLNGGVPSQKFGEVMGLANAGVGQCVSPVQGLWVLTHVANAIRRMRAMDELNPKDVLNAYLAKVCSERDQMWPMTSAPDDFATIQCYDAPHGSVLTLRVPHNVSVADFLAAEADFRGDPEIATRGLYVGQDRLDSQAIVSAYTNVAFGPVDSPVQPQPDVCCPCAQFPPDHVRSVTSNATETRTDEQRVDVSMGSQISQTLPFTVQDTTPVVALSNLEGPQFLELVPPKISKGEDVHDQLQSKIPSGDRLQLIAKQGDIWADDEIRFAFEVLAASYQHDIPLFAWDPLMMTSIVRYGHLDALEYYTSKLPDIALIMTAVNVEGHWFPLLWKRNANCLMGTTCGHAFDLSVALQAIHATVARLLKCPCLPLQFTRLPFVVDSFCGAMSIHYIAAEIFQRPLVSSMPELQTIHESLRLDFCQALLSSTSRPWTWGRGELQPQVMLKALLTEHGVPEAVVDERVQHVITKIGIAPITAALQSPVPWKEVKWAANRAVPMVQLVLPSELKDHITKKGEVLQAGNRSQKKTKGKAAGKGGTSPKIDPATLRIETGIFTCGEGIPLQQVDLSQIGPTTSGVVLCSVSASIPFLKTGRPVSAGGLAIIVVDDPTVPFPPMIPVEQIRLPVICTANGQPLLIDGRMIQLGAQHVSRKPQTEKYELVSISSSVVKVMIFRDQTTCDWNQVIAHPLKHIFSKVPILQQCQIDGCAQDCEAWHPAEACSIADPILEVWGRQWLSINFMPMQPAQAEMYSVHFRIPQCLQVQVQTYSGWDGIYCEPKDVDGKSPSTAFHVVWLPRSKYEDVLVYKQTIRGICGVARMGGKFGVRCLVADASRVHDAVRPGIPYLPPGKKEIYLVGPVPFGTIKSSLASVFDSIQWRARPLQPTPAASHIAGLMWKVQAVEDPPLHVIPTEHGEMVVSKVSEAAPPSVKTSGVVGASSTVQLCTTGSSASDPLQTNDPWAACLKQNGNGPKPMGIDPVELMEQRLVDAVVAKMPEQSSPAPLQSRVAELEQKVAEIADSQHKMQGLVQEQGHIHQQQIAQLEVAVSDQSHKLVGFQQQFRAQLEQQQGHLDGLFQQQLAKIEDLISGNKKPRRESPGPH